MFDKNKKKKILTKFPELPQVILVVTEINVI